MLPGATVIKDVRRVAIAMNMLAPYWVPVFERLALMGWDICVFVANEREPTCQYDQESMVSSFFSVKRTPNFTVRIPGLKGRAGYIHFQYGIWRELKTWQPDIILSSELGFRTIFCLLFKLRTSIPVIPWLCASAHTERNNGFLREKFRKWILAKAPCVLTNLTEATEYLAKELGVPENKIYQTPYTIDVAEFNNKVRLAHDRAAGLKDELRLTGTVFLYVGQTIPRKGMKELVGGLVTLDDDQLRNASFLVVGGRLPEDLRDTLMERGMHFVDVPFVQPRDLYLYYALSDVFVFPSLEDEWGIVLNEAAAAGLPIIASKFAAATIDLVEDNVNGFVIDPYDSSQVVTAIGKFIAMSREQLLQFGDASLRRVKGVDIDFTLANMHRAFISAADSQQRATIFSRDTTGRRSSTGSKTAWPRLPR